MTHTLRIGFAGTPEFAKVALQGLLEAGYPVDVVLTQPDRPAGRGMKLKASPVKELALQHQIPVLQPLSLRKGEEAQQALEALKTASLGHAPDVLVVAAYGLILPQTVLDAPRLGCLNIHGSLLPRWRGAAPIQRSIQAGDAETGVCIMQMDAGLDTGAVRLTRRLPIDWADTTATLHDKLAALGSSALLEALAEIEAGQSTAVPQPEEGVTYAEKITKVAGMIHWDLPAQQLQRTLRAFDPFPGCSTSFKGELLKCFDPVCVECHALGAAASAGKAPGTVLKVAPEGITIQTGQGALLLTTLQKAGSKRGPAAQIAQSMGIQVGDAFDTIGQGSSS